MNWSFLPGTYQGAEIGLNLGKWSLAAAWANQYKAPWFSETYHFQQADVDGELREVGYLWSLGARYQANEKLSLETAYGESKEYLWNAHFKPEIQPGSGWRRQGRPQLAKLFHERPERNFG